MIPKPRITTYPTEFCAACGERGCNRMGVGSRFFCNSACETAGPNMELNMARPKKANGNGHDTETEENRPGWRGDRDFTLSDEPPDEVVNIAVETLSGDIRDFILDRLRHEQSKMPWHQRSEADQRDTVHQVEAAVQDVVRRAVELIAAQGLRTIKATLEQVTVKDGIVGKLVMSKFDAQRHALTDSVGSTVLVVVADPDEFTGERKPVEITPDQRELTEAMVVHSDPDNATATPFH